MLPVVIILLICFFIWCRPVVKRHQLAGGYVTRKRGIIAVIYGLIPATIVLLLLEIAVGWIFKWMGIKDDTLLKAFLDAFIIFGFIEELTKYFFARLALKGMDRFKKIDIMLIFGAVGLGYEFTEALMFGNPFAAIARGLTIAHVMYQFIMGHFFFESMLAKEEGRDADAKKYRIYSMLVPVIIHGINDFFCQIAGMYSGKTPAADMSTASVILVGVSLVLIIATNVFGLVWGLKLAKKTPEAEVSMNISGLK